MQCTNAKLRNPGKETSNCTKINTVPTPAIEPSRPCDPPCWQWRSVLLHGVSPCCPQHLQAGEPVCLPTTTERPAFINVLTHLVHAVELLLCRPLLINARGLLGTAGRGAASSGTRRWHTSTASGATSSCSSRTPLRCRCTAAARWGCVSASSTSRSTRAWALRARPSCDAGTDLGGGPPPQRAAVWPRAGGGGGGSGAAQRLELVVLDTHLLEIVHLTSSVPTALAAAIAACAVVTASSPATVCGSWSLLMRHVWNCGSNDKTQIEDVPWKSISNCLMKIRPSEICTQYKQIDEVNPSTDGGPSEELRCEVQNLSALLQWAARSASYFTCYDVIGVSYIFIDVSYIQSRIYECHTFWSMKIIYQMYDTILEMYDIILQNVWHSYIFLGLCQDTPIKCGSTSVGEQNHRSIIHVWNKEELYETKKNCMN